MKIVVVWITSCFVCLPFLNVPCGQRDKKNRHITQRNKEQRVKCNAEKREVEIKWMEEEVTEGEEEGTIHKQSADAQPKKLILNL